jgi:hypothetical protein
MVRSRRGTRELVRVEAVVGEDGEVRLTRALHEQGGQLVRSLPPEADARLVQRVDAEHGAVVVEVGRELAFALGGELTSAVALAPFGATGLAHEGEGDTTLLLGVPADSVLPRSVHVHCADGGHGLLRCEGRLDREVALAHAAAEGVRTSLEGAVALEVMRTEDGLARSDLTLRFDVVTRLGALEEHDANEVWLRTQRVR